MRRFALLPMIALVATSPASVPVASAHPHQPEPVADADRICARFIQDHREERRDYRNAPQPMLAPPPPPPPPPPMAPPPSPPPYVSSDQSTVVTGNRVAQPNLTTTAPVTVMNRGTVSSQGLINSLPQLRRSPEN